MTAISTRKLKLELPTGEVSDEISRAIVLSAESDSDFVTFAEAAGGGARDYKLALTMAQDAATGSLWSQVWDNAGDDVEVTMMPYGNEVATPAEPHFTMTATIVEPDGDLLGGEADKSTTAKFVTEVEWPLTSKPLRVTA
jgi:hypothetical protein